MVAMPAKQANSSSLELEQLTLKDANGHTPLVAALRNVSEPHKLALQPTAQHSASYISGSRRIRPVQSQRTSVGPALTCNHRRS